MKSERDLFITNATKPLPNQHYLASPYTSHTEEAQKQYTEASRQAGVTLRQRGYAVYCPLLAGSHALHSGWYHYDLAHVRDCRAGILILTLPGWEKSHGIQLEIAAALALGYPVQLMDPTNLVDPELLKEIHSNHPLPPDITVDDDGMSTTMNHDGDPIETKMITTHFAAGNSIDDTAKEMNISPETVCNALRYHLG